MRTLQLIILAAVVLFASIRAEGSITWQKTTAEIKPGLTDQVVKVAFPFTNSGHAAVSITGTRPSCGCTTVKLGKKVYAPGESGEITAEVKLGEELTETMERTVLVTTDDSTEGQVLKIRVLFSPVIHMQPAELVWTVGRPGEAKVVRVTAAEGIKLEPISSKCEHSAIDVTHKVVEKGRVVELRVHPNDTGGSLIRYVILVADMSDEKGTVRKEIQIPIRIDYDF